MKIYLTDKRTPYKCGICGQKQGINSTHIVIDNGIHKFGFHVINDDGERCFEAFLAYLDSFTRVNYLKYVEKF
jgi:hypothetical protein